MADLEWARWRAPHPFCRKFNFFKCKTQAKICLFQKEFQPVSATATLCTIRLERSQMLATSIWGGFYNLFSLYKEYRDLQDTTNWIHLLFSHILHVEFTKRLCHRSLSFKHPSHMPLNSISQVKFKKSSCRPDNLSSQGPLFYCLLSIPL